MINPTFIPNPLYIYKYVHSSCDMIRATPIERSIHIYMDLSHDCNEILIGCFLIWILEGTSIMYASPVHMCILLYFIMTWLQSVVTAVHEYGIYEISPIIKNYKILGLLSTLYHNNIALLHFMLTNFSNKYIHMTSFVLLLWCTLCVMVNETAACIVWWMLGLPGWLLAGLQMSYKKVFFLQKEAGRPYDFFKVISQLTFVTLLIMFAIFIIYEQFVIIYIVT